MLARFFYIVLLAFISSPAFGQEDPEKYLHDLIVISQMPVNGLPVTGRVLSNTFSKDKNAHHIYLQQTLYDKPVENAIASLHYDRRGNIVHFTNKFITPDPGIKTISHSGLTGLLPRIKAEGFLSHEIEAERSVTKDIHIFRSGSVSFTVKEYYSVNRSGEILPVFVVTLPVNGEYFALKFHGKTYDLIERIKAERHCDHPSVPGLNDKNAHSAGRSCKNRDTEYSPENSKATYLILPYPYENPLQSDFAIVEENLNFASPNGWHDGNGIIGQNFTITKGNNVHAYNDRANTSFPLGDEPHSATRNFVGYSTDIHAEPEDLIELNTVQMFYSVNYLHDLLHRLGFDEESGNFQLFNYSGAPGEADEVRAMVQVDGEAKGILNEASFFTDIDGIKPRLKVSLFSTGNKSQFNIHSPGDISGPYRTSGASFGAEIPASGIEGKVVLARTGESFPPFLGCDTFENTDEMAGNIALIDRGDCQFRDKVARAENAGAIAAIICNFEDAVISMGGGGTLHNPDIPAIMIQASVCQEIKLKLLAHEEVLVAIDKPFYEGPSFIDGSMDNGVIAHEFMHGVTDRLVGGRLNSNCLFNAENMAEGWSDFLALALTFRESEMNSSTPRGIAAYLNDQEAEGLGIRRFPYNVSPENDLTYADISGAATVHQTGEIWATILWEIFWNFIEKYGADESYEDENSGNFKALYLIVEALKFTACDPGFTDARDGILAADQVLFEGQNNCLLWQIFAKRGLGNKAFQGSTQDRNDGLADYSLPPSCVQPVYIEKHMPDLFSVYSDNQVSLHIQNTGNTTFANIAILDTLPPGFVINNLQPLMPFTISDDILTIEVSDFRSGEIVEITYTLVAGPETEPSKSIIFDPAENHGPGWSVVNLFGDLTWELTPFDPYEGNASWNAYFSFGSSNHFLIWQPGISDPITRPFLRFYHKYTNPPGISGGTLNVSGDGGETFVSLENEILKSTYPRRVNPRVFSQSKSGGYSGDSGGYRMALVDLKGRYSDQMQILWKFGTFNTTSPVERTGWTIDNIEILDAVYYDTGIAVMNTDNHTVIASLPKSSNRGMLLDTALPTSRTQNNPPETIWKVYPNPAESYFVVEFPQSSFAPFTMNLVDTKGMLTASRTVETIDSQNTVVWNTARLNPGIYFLQILNKSGMITKKIIIR